MISISVFIVFFIGLLIFLGGFLSKKRWLNLIGVFLIVLAGWMLISELLTGTKF